MESLTEQAQRSVGILCSSFENSLSGIKTVKALRAESQAIAATVASAQEVKKTAIKIGKVVAVLAPLLRRCFVTAVRHFSTSAFQLSANSKKIREGQ